MKKKIFITILIVFIYIIVFNTISVYANPIDSITAKSPGDDALAVFNSLRGKIYTIIVGIGTGIAVIALLILAIKYITSAPKDRAELKKYIVTYTISAILFFGAVGIVEAIKAFGLGIGKIS